jgi:aspartate aminotransferase
MDERALRGVYWSMKLSERVRLLKPSSTVAVMNRAKLLKSQGVDVLNFSAGEPDFPTPKVAADAGIAAITAGDTKYQPANGDVATRELIAKRLTEINRIPNVTPDHIAVTTGVKMALYLAFQAIFDTGSAEQGEMILPVPAWVSFAPMAQLAGAKVVEVVTTPESHYKITPAQLRAAFTPRTRCVLINSPSNPCSTMYTPDELKALADVIDEMSRTVAPHVIVVADELYQTLVYGSTPFASIGSFANVAERTITINGPGKSYAMTGWRLGWLSGSGVFGKEFVGAISKLLGQTTTCIPGFCAAAMRAALMQADEDLKKMRHAFAKRADVIYQELAALPGVKVAKPEGAFYIFPDVSSCYGKTSPKGVKITKASEFAAALLDEQLVAVVPGEDFGAGCEKNIRMTFACGEEAIREGVRRVGVFMASLK